MIYACHSLSSHSYIPTKSDSQLNTLNSKEFLKITPKQCNNNIIELGQWMMLHDPMF